TTSFPRSATAGLDPLALHDALPILIVFCVVVSGISGAGDLKKVGRIGLKSVIYFEVLTTIALVIGLVFAFTTGIGSGANIHLERSEEHTSELQSRENLVCRLLLEKQ